MLTEVFIELNTVHLVAVEQIFDLPPVILFVHGVAVFLALWLSSLLEAVVLSLPVKWEFWVQSVGPNLKVVVVIMAVLGLVPLKLLIKSEVAPLKLLSCDWVEIASS